MDNNTSRQDITDTDNEQAQQSATDNKALQLENEALKERNKELEEQNKKLREIIDALRDIEKHVSGEGVLEKNTPKPVNEKPDTPLLLDPVIENQIAANLQKQDLRLKPQFEQLAALLSLNAQQEKEHTYHGDLQLER